MEKVEDKQLAQVQTEIDEATKNSKKLEDEFDDDANFLDQLKEKVIIGRQMRGCKTNLESANVRMCTCAKNIIALAPVTSCCARNCCSRRYLRLTSPKSAETNLTR